MGIGVDPMELPYPSFEYGITKVDHVRPELTAKAVRDWRRLSSAADVLGDNTPSRGIN
jgi:hypothetical protein